MATGLGILAVQYRETKILIKKNKGLQMTTYKTSSRKVISEGLKAKSKANFQSILRAGR